MRLSGRTGLAIFILVSFIIILLGLLWIFFIGDSSFWSSKLTIIFTALGVLIATSQWLLPISPENHKEPTNLDTTTQGQESIYLTREAQEQRQKAVEQENKLKSKRQHRRIIIRSSIALSIVFAAVFVYLQFFSNPFVYAGPFDIPYPGQVTSVAWSPDGKLLALTTNGEVRIWNNASENSRLIYQTNTTINTISWSSDNRHIAFGGNDNKVEIADATTEELSSTYFRLSDNVLAIAWSPTESRYIAFGGKDNTVQVWNVANKQRIVTYNENDMVQALAWSRDGKYLASAGDDGKLHVWDAMTGKDYFSYSGYIGSVKALKWSPSSNSLLASANNDYQVRIWDTTKKDFADNPVKIYKDPTGNVNDIDWSPDGNDIAIADAGGRLHIWDWQTTPQKDAGSFQFYLSPPGIGAVFELTAVGWSSDTSSIALGESSASETFLPYDSIRIIIFCKRWCFHGLFGNMSN